MRKLCSLTRNESSSGNSERRKSFAAMVIAETAPAASLMSAPGPAPELPASSATVPAVDPSRLEPVLSTSAPEDAPAASPELTATAPFQLSCHTWLAPTPAGRQFHVGVPPTNAKRERGLCSLFDASRGREGSKEQT